MTRLTDANSTDATRLALVVSGLTLAGVLVSALIVITIGQPFWREWALAAGATITATLISLPPLLWGLKQPPTTAAAAWFGSTLARAPIVIGAFLVGAYALELARLPLLFLLMGLYFVMLGAEAATVGRAMWDRAEPPIGPVHGSDGGSTDARRAKLETT